ncbi:hypothetical protein ACFYNO_01410 [Kitasatospora sp. NPDC006697]|uniref:hypothetical protein n=1 Tax=Kitasatospora sp. NPDC006697 TaxID=3364020 RepID=UPI0036A70D53
MDTTLRPTGAPMFNQIDHRILLRWGLRQYRPDAGPRHDPLLTVTWSPARTAAPCRCRSTSSRPPRRWTACSA